MKKLNLIIVLLLSTAAAFGQADSLGVTPEEIGAFVNFGVKILDATHNTAIPGVPNAVTGGLITGLAGLFIRWRVRVRRKKKEALKNA